MGSVTNEWNSFFIYLGDIVFFLVFLLFLIRTRKTRFNFAKKNWFLLVFILIAFISIFISSATKISIFRWLKLIELIILYIYIISNSKSQTPNHAYRQAGSKSFFNNILYVIFYSGVFQSILAIAQFIKNGSIGIKFIEASVFDPNSPGVANFILNGDRILRSYGSFTHPNVLAGFLLLSAFCFYWLFLKNQSKNLIPVLGFLFLVAGLFLTFSRTAIIVFGVMSMIMFLFKLFKLRKLEHTEQRLEDSKKLVKLFCLVVASCLLAIIILFPYIKARFFTISLEEQAVDLRFFYNKMAIEMIKEKPILGIGIGNFVNYSQNYPVYTKAALKMTGENTNQIPEWIYQPVHNIYLLITSEMGILGLLAFLGFVGWNLIRGRKNICFLSLVSCFLIVSLVDHYFWTLQQGAIMLWLGLALIFPKEIK
jgi:O-antigen ligase